MNKMEDRVSTKLNKTQYDFDPDCGTFDAIFIVKQIFENAKEK